MVHLNHLNSELTCPRCSKNGMLTEDSTGEEFCGKCGFVINEKINADGPEWRSFQKDGGRDPTRTGAPTSLAIHDRGLATIISPINRDSSGKPLTASMKTTLKRLRTWDGRSQAGNPTDRNLRQAFGELSKLKDKLSLSNSIVEKAAYIYRKAIDKKLVRGRSINGMIAASLYAACREIEAPRTIKDVGDAANIKRKDIARCYRILHRELELKMPVTDPIQCVARISSSINISEKTKRYAIEIIQTAQKNEESAGKNPMGLAAAALYLSCVENNEGTTQRIISESANVTEVTIRNRYKGLKDDMQNHSKQSRDLVC